MELKEKLILARAKMNLSQQMLAKELNVSYVTISRWENGNSDPTKKAVAKFYDFCNINNLNIGNGECYD